VRKVIPIPKRSVLLKISKVMTKFEFDFAIGDDTGERAFEIYDGYEKLPKTFTCAAVANALNVTINGPCMGDEKPFLLSANDENDVPCMVKVLRIDMDSPVHSNLKLAEYHMEKDVLTILDFSGGQPGLIKAKFLEVSVPRGETSVLSGATAVPHKDEKKGDAANSIVYAILMPRYITTVAKSPKFHVKTLLVQVTKFVETLEYIHSNNIVHLDIKGDNIFIDANGEWFIGDFGSCKRIGDTVVTTTTLFHWQNIVGKKATPHFDYSMLLVMLLIELLPDKHSFLVSLSEPSETGVTRMSKEKVTTMANQYQADFPALRDLIQLLVDRSV